MCVYAVSWAIIYYYHVVDNFNCQQESLSQPVSWEAEVSEKAEVVLQTTKPFKSPENSRLVTSPSHSTQFAEGQHMTSIESKYQQFAELLAATRVSIQTVTKFIYASVGCIPAWHYRISQLLSPIVDVILNAEDVFAVENIVNMLRAIVVEVSKALVCLCVKLL